MLALLLLHRYATYALLHRYASDAPLDRYAAMRSWIAMLATPLLLRFGSLC
jgi:hypothetical protein